MRVENVGVVFTKTFFRLLLDRAYLRTGQGHRRAKTLQFCLNLGRLDLPVIDLRRPGVHSQHLPNHDTFGNAQALATNFVGWFGHSEVSGSSSPNPAAKNSSIAFIATSSSAPSTVARNSVPWFAASINTLRIDLASAVTEPSARRNSTWL